MKDRPLLRSPPHRRYFVVAERGGERLWWDYFLVRDLTHCYLLIWDEFVWIVVNPTVGITEVSLVPVAEGGFQHPAEWLGPSGVTVEEASLEYDDGVRHPWVFGAITCVEAVKSCLGIRRFWLLTPRQLLRHVARRRTHGRESQESPADTRGKSPAAGAAADHQQAG